MKYLIILHGASLRFYVSCTVIPGLTQELPLRLSMKKDNPEMKNLAAGGTQNFCR
jgi:hypothetical protein